MPTVLLTLSAVLLAVATNGVVSSVVRRRSGVRFGAVAALAGAASLGCLASLLVAAIHA